MDQNRRTLTTFRLHLLLTSSITTLTFIAVIAVSLFLPLALHLDREGLGSVASAGIAEHFLYLHAAFWPVALCSLCGCIATALLLYRKMVGPLVQFIRCFEAIGRGECPDEISIRRSDYLGVEVSALNRMIADLRQQSRCRSEALAELDAIADELLECSDDPVDASAMASRIRNLKGLR